MRISKELGARFCSPESIPLVPPGRVLHVTNLLAVPLSSERDLQGKRYLNSFTGKNTAFVGCLYQHDFS